MVGRRLGFRGAQTSPRADPDIMTERTSERPVVQLGGRSVDVETAAQWIRDYFDEEANAAAAAAPAGKPFAYPVYDRMATGSGPNELNDGDLLAPLLLNAAPSITAAFRLQAVRPALAAGLSAIPETLTLPDAVADGRHRPLLEGLVEVLDAPGGVRGVRLTTLTKILHRKRPLFVPLFDQRVMACYWTKMPTPGYPMHRVHGRSRARFYTTLAECIVHDLDTQRDAWEALAAQAPADLSLLRVFDVVAWNCGRHS